MQTNSHFEKANFRALIAEDGLGDIDKRLNLIDLFLHTEEHITVEELMDLLKKRGYDYEPDFVRQCMNRWVELGFAQKKTFEGQPPRYEHRHLGRHHDHLICTKCGKIVEFRNDEIEQLQARIAAMEGFHILQHKMEIYGICPDCLKKRRPLMPLSLAKPGERVVITDILGGREVRTRLGSMGLRPSDQLEVISNPGMGRLIVGHGTTRLALGRGMAQKILVSLNTKS